MIVDERRRAGAHLFTGGDQGGSNGQGLTFANRIDPFLAALDLTLAARA